MGRLRRRRRSTWATESTTPSRTRSRTSACRRRPFASGLPFRRSTGSPRMNLCWPPTARCIMAMGLLAPSSRNTTAMRRPIELIGRRWTGAILGAMLSGETRYTDIIQAVPGLSDRLLSERLKELEAEGIVVRHVHPDTPVRIEYCLTAKGRDLGEVTDAVSAWAHRWSAEGVSGQENHSSLTPDP